MFRPLHTVLVLTSVLCMALTAQASPTGSLTYKVSMGGLNAGTFKNMGISTHGVTLSGNDVRVTPQSTNAGKPIPISGGTVVPFTLRILTPKVGEQMTVRVEVIPVGVGPGQRCTFTLDRAMLQKVDETSLMLKPSELPKYKCVGGKR